MTRAQQLRDRLIFIQKSKGKTDEEAVRLALDYMTAFINSYSMSNQTLIKALEQRINIIDNQMSRDDKKQFLFRTAN